MTEAAKAVTHEGGCHCGRIAFEFDGEIGAVMDCNCTFCQKRGGLLHFVPATAFRLRTTPVFLSTYQFHKHVLKHHFCNVCGISPFSEGKNAKGEASMAVNVKCVEGLDWRTLPVKFFDGRSR